MDLYPFSPLFSFGEGPLRPSTGKCFFKFDWIEAHFLRQHRPEGTVEYRDPILVNGPEQDLFHFRPLPHRLGLFVHEKGGWEHASNDRISDHRQFHRIPKLFLQHRHSCLLKHVTVRTIKIRKLGNLYFAGLMGRREFQYCEVTRQFRGPRPQSPRARETQPECEDPTPEKTQPRSCRHSVLPHNPNSFLSVLQQGLHRGPRHVASP